MNAVTRLLAITFAVMLSGCSASREYFIHRDILASGNADHGNVYVHIGNFGQQRVLSLQCDLESNEGEIGNVHGLIDFDVYNLVTFAFNVKPGLYWLEFSDGIRAEPWKVHFEATTMPIHIHLTYALEPAEPHPDKEGESTPYKASLFTEFTDAPPKKGR
jgi:hypothetical protein